MSKGERKKQGNINQKKGNENINKYTNKEANPH